MAEKTETKTAEKKEINTKANRALPIKYFLPLTDIVETDLDIQFSLEMPGVKKENIDISDDKNMLVIDGRIDVDHYKGLQPIHSEYNVGHYIRKFSLPNKLDTDKIKADLNSGVLHLSVPKKEDEQPRKISIQ